MRATAVATVCALAAATCASPPRAVVPSPVVEPGDGVQRIERWSRTEEQALEWLSAADPRLAARTGTTASEEILARIGKEAILSEDAAARVVGHSLDLFAFRARARALEAAHDLVVSFRDPLPDGGSERPRLERELLLRVVAEEQARTTDESHLGDESGALVRGILSTWTPPATPQDWPDRDLWVSQHLLEIRDSLRRPGPHERPIDLDASLYPLERLLAPLQFPRGAAAIAQVRVELDADMRAVPPLMDSDRLALALGVHVGFPLDRGALQARLEGVEPRIRQLAEGALASVPPGSERGAALARASTLLFVEGPCPAVSGSRVRAMGAPPERAMICGVLAALGDEPRRPEALVALHDDVLLALAAVTTSPPPRTGLLSSPENDRIDALRKMARERPVPVLAAALVAYVLCSGGDPIARLEAWRTLGEVPLDVAQAELARLAP